MAVKAKFIPAPVYAPDRDWDYPCLGGFPVGSWEDHWSEIFTPLPKGTKVVLKQK